MQFYITLTLVVYILSWHESQLPLPPDQAARILSLHEESIKQFVAQLPGHRYEVNITETKFPKSGEQLTETEQLFSFGREMVLVDRRMLTSSSGSIPWHRRVFLANPRYSATIWAPEKSQPLTIDSVESGTRENFWIYKPTHINVFYAPYLAQGDLIASLQSSYKLQFLGVFRGEIKEKPCFVFRFRRPGGPGFTVEMDYCISEAVNYAIAGWTWYLYDPKQNKSIWAECDITFGNQYKTNGIHEAATIRFLKNGIVTSENTGTIRVLESNTPIPDAEFTLSHYGFPEPGETIKPTWQPSPLYIGAFVAGLALLVVSAWLLRRRQKAAV